MSQAVLFVCLGNICRSPAAQGIFRNLAPGFQTDSAGTASWHVGKPPYEAMQVSLWARGLDISDPRARQVSLSDYDQFELIIVMDSENQNDVEMLRPSGSSTPVHLFTDYIEGEEGEPVPDPYYTRDFDGCLDLIERAAHGLKAALDAHTLSAGRHLKGLKR